MRRVEFVTVSHRLVKRDHLVGQRIGPRGIPQSRGHSQGARVEALLDKSGHVSKFIDCRAAVIHAHHSGADGAVSNLCCDVDRGTALLHGVQIAVEIFPIDLECAFATTSQAFSELVSCRAVQRGAKAHPAVSEVFEGNALGEF